MISYEQENKDLYLPRFVYEQKWDFLHQNGRLPRRKKGVIPVCYSEKWFWGIILRDYDKQCKDLVIYKLYFKKFHENHINKLMGIGSVATYFDITLDIGCIVKNIPFICARVINKVYRRVHNSRTLTYL